MVPCVAAVILVGLTSASTLAQESSSPTPLYPGGPSSAIVGEKRPPGVVAQPAPSPLPTGNAAATEDPAGRVFCQQTVATRLADRGAVPDRYRAFIGMWSDAAWTPQLCAALVVENVTADGTATVVYAFGPMTASGGAGGVLHGTGIVRDGELRFQNADGSQFAFRPLYADLEGHLTTPQGQRYDAVFKKTP